VRSGDGKYQKMEGRMSDQPKPVRKAVIAAAGFGTRFLPQTKAMPKEMLPLIDKPIIQYVVEELVAAGIEDIIIVTGYSKRSIEDHFDGPSQDLITNLRQGGESKKHLLGEVEAISNLANFVYVRQKGPYGNGTPLLNVEHLIGDEPFIYTWSDDFIKSSPLRFSQMIDAYQKYESSIMSTIEATTEADYKRYGFAAGEMLEEGCIDVKYILEKPGSKENSPSSLATVSGCLLTSDVFSYLKKAKSELVEGSELYYNDALRLMVNDNKRVIALKIQNAKYYDAGNKLEYLKTVVDFALEHPELGSDFLEYLKTKI
jgi:UTP--glucose-1-phosphate uridylyltransferase